MQTEISRAEFRRRMPVGSRWDAFFGGGTVPSPRVVTRVTEKIVYFDTPGMGSGRSRLGFEQDETYWLGEAGSLSVVSGFNGYTIRYEPVRS